MSSSKQCFCSTNKTLLIDKGETCSRVVSGVRYNFKTLECPFCLRSIAQTMPSKNLLKK